MGLPQLQKTKLQTEKGFRWASADLYPLVSLHLNKTLSVLPVWPRLEEQISFLSKFDFLAFRKMTASFPVNYTAVLPTTAASNATKVLAQMFSLHCSAWLWDYYFMTTSTLLKGILTYKPRLMVELELAGGQNSHGPTTKRH